MHLSCVGMDTALTHGPSVLNRNIVTFTTGLRHTCAIADDSTAWCWGERLWTTRVGDNDDRNAPTQVLLPAGTTLISINAGGHTTCVILNNGTGLCWGAITDIPDGTYNNRNGQPNLNNLSNRSLAAMDLGAGYYAESWTTVRLTVGATAPSPLESPRSVGRRLQRELQVP